MCLPKWSRNTPSSEVFRVKINKSIGYTKIGLALFLAANAQRSPLPYSLRNGTHLHSSTAVIRTLWTAPITIEQINEY